ncbi:hypothetical protein BSG1_16420 [Bacillus sp. SG-1]|nr:hypothetical protein BSG1_16420 [Bacillus sp. SG-1]
MFLSLHYMVKKYILSLPCDYQGKHKPYIHFMVSHDNFFSGQLKKKGGFQ